jgi:V8-like Glu-specific endopeptidase
MLNKICLMILVTSANGFAAPVVDWSQFNDSVLLRVQRSKKSKIGNTICTGVVVAPKRVITTAHCVDEAENIGVVFDPENGPLAKKVMNVLSKKIKKHPKYDRRRSLYEFDLARIELPADAPIELRWIRRVPEKIELNKNQELKRIGVGLRNSQNLRAYTDPRFIAVTRGSVLETSDLYSYLGDSGGPIYTEGFVLIGVHSTLDAFDGRSSPKAFAVYLPKFREWIFEK